MRQVFFVPVVSRSLVSGWGKGGLRKMGNAKVEESKKVVTNYDITCFSFYWLAFIRHIMLITKTYNLNFSIYFEANLKQNILFNSIRCLILM